MWSLVKSDVVVIGWSENLLSALHGTWLATTGQILYTLHNPEQ